MIKAFVFLHVVGACVWVGGHLLLLFRFLPEALKNRNAEMILAFEQKYEPIGIPALLIQVITGILLGLHYQIRWFTFDSVLNITFNLKFMLLILTVLLAIHARFFIIPRLDETNLAKLAYHILAVTLLSLGFVFLGLSFRFSY